MSNGKAGIAIGAGLLAGLGLIAVVILKKGKEEGEDDTPRFDTDTLRETMSEKVLEHTTVIERVKTERVEDLATLQAMKDALAIFKENAERYRLIAEDAQRRLDESKRQSAEGQLNFGQKVNNFVDSINEFREMTGGKPTTIEKFNLEGLKARIDKSIGKRAAVERRELGWR